MALPKPEYASSFDEFLALREHPYGHRYELRDGQIVAMAPVSRNHAVLESNLIGLLYAGLRGKRCRVFTRSVAVTIEDDESYYLPDVSVVCGEMLFDPRMPKTITNPVVLLEILSPSTERLDRGAKMQHYMSLPSLKDYLLVSQSQYRIEHYQRQDELGQQWLLTSYAQLSARLELTSIGCSLLLSEVYDGVNLADAEQD